MERRAQIEQSYFKFLPFAPAEITCVALPEILAEKIRACYQRNKARDIYDLGMFARRPLDQSLVRRLVVLKLWPRRLPHYFEIHRMDATWCGGFRRGLQGARPRANLRRLRQGLRISAESDGRRTHACQ